MQGVKEGWCQPQQVVGMRCDTHHLSTVRYGEIPTRDPLRHEIGCRVKESNQSFCVLAVVMLTHTMNEGTKSVTVFGT